MARTALTVIGYAVGSYFGYPQLGAAVGAYIGGIVDPTKIEGPRITDTTTQQSSYGAGIARTWGGDRVAGTVIWADVMREHVNEEGSKGDSVETTTYTYTRSFAILIGEGYIEGIRRIWADTKLILDYRDADDNIAQAGSYGTARYFEFYQGTEDQLPDPTIEAIEGEGNVEAYRGRSYIVFTDFPLADYGNRIPMFSFETTNEEMVPSNDVHLEPLRIYQWGMTDTGIPFHNVPRPEYVGPIQYFGVSTAVAESSDFASVAAAQAAAYSGAQYQGAGLSVNPIPFPKTIFTATDNNTLNILGGASLSTDPEQVYTRTAYDGDKYLDISGGPILPPGKWLILVGSLEAIAYTKTYNVFLESPVPDIGFGATYYAGNISGPINYVTYGNTLLVVGAERLPALPPDSCYPGVDPCAEDTLAELPDSPGYCFSCDGTVSPKYVYEHVSGTAKQLCAIEYRSGVLYQNALGPVLLPGHPDYDNAAFWEAAFDAAVLAGEAEADVAHPAVVDAYARGVRQDVFEVAAGSALLSDIVADICEECGLAPSQYDVDALDDVVLGFTRGRRMSGRATLEPLRTAFFFDAVESGDLIRFVKRGGAPVGTVDADDLSAALEDSTEDQVVSERGQEAELPRSVTIAYKAVTADFQTGTQLSRRRLGDSEQKAGTELAVALTDAKAAQVAEVLLYDSWVGRSKRSFALWRKWSAIEPTDVLLVNDGDFTYRLRVLETSEQDGVITVTDARDDDAATYTSSVAGSPVSGGGASLSIPGPTTFELMDIPLLRQSDDSASFYLGASGYLTTWRGGRIFRSTDGGATFSAFQDVTRKAVMGAASSVLASYGGGNTIDQLNTVDVTVREGGELSSITLGQLLQSGNPALLGDEVLQFMRATLLAPGVYRLGGLLRGRFGTEQHIGTHAVGDRFILLSQALLYRPAFELSLVGSELTYKAASFGESTAGSEVEFTNTAASLKPLSPVHVHIARQPDGAYLAQWVRRTRYSEGGVRFGVNAPLAETAERYRVRVLDGVSVLETKEVTVPLATLGTPGSPSEEYAGATLEVVQLSDLVGEGFAASVVIP